LNSLLSWLEGGDLRSDGEASQVADFVLAHPEALSDLLGGLRSTKDVIRGRSADAVEKVARARPDWIAHEAGHLAALARTDDLPMVRWHLAMTLAHLAGSPALVDLIVETLTALLADGSAFVRSWAIAGLCVVERLYPERLHEFLADISTLQSDPRASVRSRARRAVRILLNDDAPFPAGWNKSQRIRV
jgi:HEAT repeat protein